VRKILSTLAIATSLAGCASDHQADNASSKFVCFALKSDDWTGAGEFEKLFVADGNLLPGMTGFRLEIIGHDARLVVDLTPSVDPTAWARDLPSEINRSPSLVSWSVTQRECSAN
jgi:hypothetical protein